MKRAILLLILILLILPLVKAEFNPEQASNYVSQQDSSEIIEKSFQVLSLSFYDPTTADKIATQIKASGNNCWPSPCAVKETSLALIALAKRGEETDKSWLMSQQTANPSGKWYLQIQTSGTGTCKVQYDSLESIITVAGGDLSTSLCPTKAPKLDINSCITPNLLSEPGKKLIIDCSGLSGAPTISLFNQEGNAYYLLDKASSTQKLTVYVNNGFFEALEPTLFANWFLSDINSEINSVIYLKKNFDKTSVLHNTLMYLITSDEAYLASLTKLQDATTGSFGDTYSTAIATLALARSGKYNSALESARTFLGNKQLSDGSVENNLLSTAVVLYSYSITKLSAPTTARCGDGSCNGDETQTTCPEDCKKTPTPSVCIADGSCDTEYGENSINCPEDCKEEPVEKCGDGLCEVEYKEDETTCPEDCKKEEPTPEKSSAFIWIILIIILLLILGLLYYTQFYKKGKTLFGKKKPPEKPDFKPLMIHPKPAPAKPFRTPVYTSKPAKKSKVEEELEKSLEEAKKLLRK